MALFEKDDRVKAHPATDVFMAGDVYGTVVNIGHKYIHVLMDRSGKVRRFAPENLIGLDNKEGSDA
ncbi:hypothetical protein MADRUGA_48 [Mycobacterium phage Madruga]|uniref:Uncharacterized protein n=1 Tax=Mycobacterium phage Madruga TaxID=1675552 RepID=A0A0K1LT48_9CAUD|nr:hypothetical protein MADRUGA_48 [Mycobacterium phage Madruga]